MTIKEVNSGSAKPTATQRAKKKKKVNVSNLLQKAGGVEGVLDTVSVGAGKAAAMIRNKKGTAGTEGVGFEAGAREEDKQGEVIFGMPAVAAYTLILVVFILVLFVVFKMASKK